MKIVGAIDIGSNAIRMICARLTPDRRVEIIETNRTPIRLGKDVFHTGYLSDTTLESLIHALQIYRKTLEQNECKEIRAYATSAMREADNREEAIERIERATGIRLETISGGKEAQLLQRAIRRVMDLEQGRYLLADLGGGSVEITLLVQGEIQFAESFRMGTVRLLQMFPYTPETEREFRRWTKTIMRDFTETLQTRLPCDQIDALVITGGNANALARLFDRTLVGSGTYERNVCYLPRDTFHLLKKLVKHSSLEERVEKYEMSPDRADVIVPAMMVFDGLLRFSGSNTLAIPMVGLRDGILDEMLEDTVGATVSGEYEQVLHSAFYYARRYQANVRHARTVHHLAVQLFDGTQALHQLNQRDRLLLEVAAILHDIGRFIRPSSHHKHSMYIIQNIELVGVTNTELRLISLIARYHSGSPPAAKHSDYARLPSADQQRVSTLSSLLRVADALDREHRDRVHSLVVHHDPQRVLLLLNGDSDLLLAHWAVNNKKALFEEQFARRLEIERQPTLTPEVSFPS
jgi:exopolyphosphatase/guanosine-5'-triphosphate,3'-diphosphate pyrophosphatase